MLFRVNDVVAGCVVASMLSLPSCAGSSSSEGGSGASSPVPEAQLMDRLVTATCEGIAACCRSEGIPADVSACRASYAALLDQIELPDPERTEYDAVAAGVCLDQMRASAAACGDMIGDEVEACERVYTGTLPLGAACASDEECAPDAAGDVSCDYDLGTCLLQRTGVAGDVCQQTCTREDPGWSCSGSYTPPTEDPNALSTCWTNDGIYCAASGVCEALVEVGGACDDFESCVAGAHCDITTDTCEPVPGLGESCTLECASGHYCAEEGVCEAQQPDGTTCTEWDQCLGYCDTESDTGICAGAGPAEGEVSEELCAGELFEDWD